MSSSSSSRVRKPSRKAREAVPEDSDVEEDTPAPVAAAVAAPDALDRAQEDEDDEEMDEDQPRRGKGKKKKLQAPKKHAAPWGAVGVGIPKDVKEYARPRSHKATPHVDGSLMDQVASTVNLHISLNMLDLIVDESNKYAAAHADRAWARRIVAD